MDPLDQLDDAHAAAAFPRLVRPRRQRGDAPHGDLMGLAGVCRNCRADWVEDASGLDREAARRAVYGEPYAAWKARQPAASPAQLARMAESQRRNP